MYPAKWRPSIGMITAAVIVSVLLLPLVGLVFFRLYENQLVRQTESELIAQSAMLAAVRCSGARHWATICSCVRTPWIQTMLTQP